MKKIQELFRKLYSFLSREEKKEADKLLLLIIVMAILDAIGVASIMPFMTIVTDQQTIHSNMLINSIYKYMKFKSSIDFIWFMGVVVLSILLFSLVVKSYTNYKLLRFIANQEYTIGTRLLDKYLTQDYAWHINTNSALLGKNILAEVSAVIGAAMIPMMNLIPHGAITIAIITMLMFTNVELSLMVGFGLGSAYILIYFIIRNHLEDIGKERYVSNSKRFFVVSEAFKAIKAIKIESLEKVFLERFKQPSNKFAKSQSSAQILSLLPRYGMEAIAFGGVIALVFFLIIGKGGLNSSLLGEILPVLGLYTFSAYRIQPALQTVFTGFSAIRYGHDILNNIHKELSVTPEKDKNSLDVDQLIAYKHHIKFHEIYFSYSKGLDYVIENINLQISPGSVLGIVGTTGSGKTTFIDILLGLLRPTKGDIIVDGLMINNKNLSAWQRMLGYVPQEIFLSDASVAENIAFGVPKEKIDFNRVMECARVAKAHDFIVNDLDNKYDSQVGLRGVRISGGQRQRIGIARALYRDPEIIVFDEATSALDSVTEQAVMSEIFSLSPKKTVIIIAHRISTIKDCDQILVFNKGNIVASGVYEDLISSSNDFIELNKAYS